MNLFTWSIPFLCEKVTEMFDLIVKKRHMDKQLDKDAEEEAKKVFVMPKSIDLLVIRNIESEILRNKVKSISRIIRLFKVLRQDNESILKLKGLCPDNKLPRGVLLEGSDAIKNTLEQFAKAKKMDFQNEKRPQH